MKRKIVNEKAITLIALIITIVVLLILAVVAINAVTGDGIVQHASNAKVDYKEAQIEEKGILERYLDKLNIETLPVKQMSEVISNVAFTETTRIKDSSGNVVVVPTGFSILKNEAEHVTEGIVIEDKSGTSTDGNQFVWIPVGNIVKKDGTTQLIELKRYRFNETTGEIAESFESPTEPWMSEKVQNVYFSEMLKNSATKNTHAIDIEDFINSVKNYGGYYIGRYEIGIENYDITKELTDNETENEVWTGYVAEEGKKLNAVCKADRQVWNYITQKKAAQLSQDMYKSNNYVISDLMNSFAYDTAILFLQTFDNRDRNTYPLSYSIQTCVNQGDGPEKTGKSGDLICNVYELASNCYEWSTESILDSEDSEYVNTTTTRGGYYDGTGRNTASRRGGTTSVYGRKAATFRPVLYF